MTTTADIALPSTERLGQATAIEQSRAIAEVQAAIFVAQQFPRDVQAAIRDMRQSCGMQSLAERAFFRYSRAGSVVSGPSVHLARELARCWRNVQYGVAELRRDDEHGQSEMLAFAWDVQTNSRASTIFIVPHRRDRSAEKGGPVLLTDMRDIYENNANAAARRAREMIYSILPPWYVEDAKQLCMKTITDGTEDKPAPPLPKRIADMLAAFEVFGVTEGDIARKLGRDSSRWTAFDVAQLGVTYRSIERGEVSREEEFPPPAVTGAEILAIAPSDTTPQPPESPQEGGSGGGVTRDAGAPAPRPDPASTLDGDESWPPVPPPGSKRGKGGKS